jgi:hypothetical protein
MYLISQGADVHAWEDRALIRAAQEGHLDILSFLLDMYEEDPEDLRIYPTIDDMINQINRERSIISSSLRAGANIANLISAYY